MGAAALFRCGAIWSVLVLAACERPEEELPLSYDGPDTLSETVLPGLIKGYERRSGRRFGAVGSHGTVQGLRGLLEGTVDLAGMDRPLHPTEKARGLYYEILGYDALAVYVHPSNPVRNLTRQQVRGIFTGAIKRWSEVGGPDAPIELVLERAAVGRDPTNAYRISVVESSPKATTFERSIECVGDVASKPFAVTYASQAFARDAVAVVAVDGILPSRETVALAVYPLARPVVLVSRGLPEGQLRLFYGYLHSDEGRALLAERFVPLAWSP